MGLLATRVLGIGKKHCVKGILDRDAEAWECHDLLVCEMPEPDWGVLEWPLPLAPPL